MKALLTGITTGLLLAINTIFFFVPILLLALLRLIIPHRGAQRALAHALTRVAETWAEGFKLIINCCTPITWDVRGQQALSKQHSYLIISNHQSWVDIPALIEVFNNRAPYFKFFLKKELIWVPFLGFAFWALDYPFMSRYSKQKLKKHPHLKGKDLEITKTACAKFKGTPVTVVNYVEGTRFTPAKQQAQNSPYQHLLRPKAGSLAFTLGALGEQFDTLLNVTVYYPEGVPTFWQLISGQLEKVVVVVDSQPLEPTLWQGDYQNDPTFRKTIHRWVSDRWQEKDALLEELTSTHQR